MARRAPFAVEFRTSSRRTESGWTKWQHYIVAHTRQDAERIVSSDWMQDWMRRERGELRIVDRVASNTESEQEGT